MPFDVFLSHNGRDQALVERIAERLKRARIEPWLDRWQLVAGADFAPGLAAGLAASRACAVFVGPADVGGWTNQEVQVATNRMAVDPGFRVFLVLLPGVPEQFDASALFPFLATKTWVDYRGGLEDADAFNRLVSAIHGRLPGPSVPLEPGEDVCPYRGLEVFDEEHASLFFGRAGDVQRLLEKLKGTRFLAVLGASGSGKSSLVRAGLIPALRRASPETEIVVLRPGAHPLEALAARVVALGTGGAMQDTVDRLRTDPRSLDYAVRVAAPERQVLFVLDQFEEIFTLCRDEDERAALLAAVLYAAGKPEGPVGVLLTMRADFYHRCGAYPEFARQLAERQYLVSPLQRDGLYDAITGPARAVGLAFEPGLVETILDDLKGQAGALPLLEHALLELWDLRAGGLLTLAAYRKSGGVQGAIAMRADEVLATLSPEGRELARRTFLRLTQPGEGTEDTRRRASLGELEAGDEHGPVAPIVRALVDARLLTTSREDPGEGEVVEVAHEALIRNWPVLRRWVDEDRAGLRTHRRVTEAAEDWQRLGHDPDALLRGARLAAAQEWRAGNEESLNDLERTFLDAGGAAEDAARERERRQRSRLRRSAIGLGALSVVAAIVAVVAIHQTRVARDQNDVAVSRALAGEAPLHLRNEADVAALLAVEATHVSDTPEARAGLTRMVQATDYMAAIRVGGYSVLAFSRDGNLLALGNRAGAVRLWDVARGRFAGPASRGRRPGAVTLLAFSGDGRRLVAVAGERLVAWDVVAGRRLVRRVASSFLVVGRLGTLSVDARGETVAAEMRPPGCAQKRFGRGCRSNNLVLWRPGDAQATTVAAGKGETAFTADGRFVGVTHGSLSTSRVQDGNLVDESWIEYAGDCCERVALSEGGDFVAAQTRGHDIVVWDVRRGKRVFTYPVPDSVGGYGIAVSADGRTVTLGDYDGAARVYRFGEPPRVLRGRRGSIHKVRFGSDRTFASVDNRGGMIVWRPDSALEAPVTTALRTAVAPPVSREHASLNRRLAKTAEFGGDDFIAFNVALSPQATTFAVAGDDGRVTIGDPETLAGVRAVEQPDPLWPDVRYFDDDTLLTAGRDVRVWNPHTGRRLHTFFYSSDDYVNSIAVSADRRILVTGYYSGDVVAWDVATERRLWVSQAHNDFAVVAIDPTGSVVASGGREGEVKLWDVASGRALGDPLQAGEVVQALTFNGDRALVVKAQRDSTVEPIYRAWDSVLWRAEVATARLCALAGRDLTRAEWRQFLPDREYSLSCTG